MPKPGSTTQRGYGAEHRRERERWVEAVASGFVCCARCGNPIYPGTAWDLGHDDYDRTSYAGPEHASCNRKAGSRKAALLRSARARRRTRGAVDAVTTLRW